MVKKKKKVAFVDAAGSTLTDSKGRKYIDYVNGNGAILLGHAHPELTFAVQHITENGLCTDQGTVDKIYQLFNHYVANIEKIDFMPSVDEARSIALRLARAYTGRDKIIVFEGCDHGYASATGTGIPGNAASNILFATFNDIESVWELTKEHHGKIAALIVEPVASQMGCIPPEPQFLRELRRLCYLNEVVFILDECTTGFRIALGGAQERFDVDADLVIFGKVIGGGIPFGALGGIKKIMKVLEQAEYFLPKRSANNALAIACSYAVVKYLTKHREVFQQLNAMGKKLELGLRKALRENGHAFTINRTASMLSVHFSSDRVTDHQSAVNAESAKYQAFYDHMLEHGIYIPDDPFQCWYLSTALTAEQIAKTLATAADFKN